MIDRASIFANAEMLELLSTKFVPVAIDQAYERRQQDAEGEFYRRIVRQSSRGDDAQGGDSANVISSTTQGFYVATPSGELLLYSNNRGSEKVLRLTRKAALAFADSKAARADTKPMAAGPIDQTYNPRPPKGGFVVRVRSKVLGGYEPSEDHWQRVMQRSLSRDNLWVTKREHEQLVQGALPDALLRRLLRFHLVDSTRGEPPMWQAKEVRSMEITRDGDRVQGSVLLRTDDGERGYQAQLLGHLEFEKGRITRFDLVAFGEFWGEGRYTPRAPKGRFPLAVSFTLADGNDIADQIPPQGARGWVAGYLR